MEHKGNVHFSWEFNVRGTFPVTFYECYLAMLWERSLVGFLLSFGNVRYFFQYFSSEIKKSSEDEFIFYYKHF